MAAARERGTARARAQRTSLSDVTSAGCRAVACGRERCSASSAGSAAGRSSSSTRAPALAKRRAVARPRPLAAPVTSAMRPASAIIGKEAAAII